MWHVDRRSQEDCLLQDSKNSNHKVKKKMKPLVVILSTEYDPALLKQIPHALYFPERAISYLGLHSDYSRLIAVIPQVLPRSAQEYISECLFPGSASEQELNKVTFVERPIGESRSITQAILKNPLPLQTALKACGADNGCFIINFAACDADNELAQVLGGKLQEPCSDLAKEFGSKYGSKLTFDAAAVDQPEWTGQVYRSVLEAAEGLAKLFEKHKSACIKMDDAAIGGGIGNYYFSRAGNGDTLKADNLESYLESSIRPFSEFGSMVEKLGCIVEEYLPEIHAFPSGLFHLSDAGCKMLSCQDQVIVNSHFSGFRIHYNELVEEYIRSCGTRIGEELSKKGYCGSFGVDFAQLPDGRLLALEINARKTGVSHVISFVDQVLKSHGRRRDKMTSCIYRRGVFLSNDPYVNYEAAISAFRGLNESYSLRNGDGIYLLNFSAVDVNGFVEFCIITENIDVAKELEAKAIILLEKQ